ncbi:hypothetical protein TNCV_2126861 [Trichonephila clavipes]|nr:hypothetical protein TNCV_2126861 [Trichonephila clavipes]
MQYHGVGQRHDQWPHAPTCGCEWDYDGQRYIDEVLLPHVRLFCGAVEEFVLPHIRDPTSPSCHRREEKTPGARPSSGRTLFYIRNNINGEKSGSCLNLQ